jgi:hypothetical protein
MSQLSTPHRALQRLCCSLPPSEAVASGDLTDELFEVKTYLVTICEKYLDEAYDKYSNSNKERKVRHGLMNEFVALVGKFMFKQNQYKIKR